MDHRSNRARVSPLAAALALAMTVVGPSALADPAEYQQGTTGSDDAGTAKTPTPAKPAASTPPATPKADPSTRSFLPRAGASSTPPAPSVGGSRNPYLPQTKEMRRQNSRLKAQGFGSNVMNDGEIVLAFNATIKLLAKVEDGYGGHRAGAIKEIENAIHQINTKAGKAGAKLAAPTRAGKEAMPRAEADALLREAHKSLEKIVFNIGHGGNVKRLAPARDSAKKAIQELDAALGTEAR